MSLADRTHRWNEWYDGLPDRWRFQVVLWPLLLIGTINMGLTISSGFPFGLLVILAIGVIAFIRIPYNRHRRAAAPRGAAVESLKDIPDRNVRFIRVDWAWSLNKWYDGLPEWRRFWIFPAVLIVAGAINMALTLAGAFPFALLFLLALLILVLIRAPYVWGWLTPPPDRRTAAAPAPQVEREPTPVAAAFSPIGAAPATPRPTLREEAPLTINEDEPGPPLRREPFEREAAEVTLPEQMRRDTPEQSGPPGHGLDEPHKP